MSNYTPEQVQECVVMAEQNWPGSHIAGMLRDYATLRQQAGRVDEVTDEIVEHVQHSLDNHEDNRSYAEQVSARSVREALEAVWPITAALAQNTQGDGGELYVEARQCEDCDHLGLNDCSDTASACGDCEWQGPTPAEDKCPGCGHENCMAVACPICGGRYRFLADRRFHLHAERARVPDGWVPRAVAEVAQGDLHMLKKAIEARDPWPELLVRVNDTERDLRTALAAAPSQRAEVKAEERAVGVCGCGMAGIMVERNGERVCSDCRPADRAEVK